MTLAQVVCTNVVAVIVFVALGAGHVELSIAGVINFLTPLKEWRSIPVDGNIHRLAPIRMFDSNRQAQHWRFVIFERLCPHALGAAKVDLIFDIPKGAIITLFRKLGKRRANTLHRFQRIIAVAIRAGFALAALNLCPFIKTLIER